MDLTFGKVKKIPKQTNSSRNLHMRQQFGVKMLQLLFEEKRILNVDETWIGQTNFRRSGWQSKFISASEKENSVTPRVSMVVALDNFGDLYLSVHQSNTNQDSFSNFMVHLIKALDEDRPGWRQDTIIQMDGAKYHLTDQVKSVLEQHKVPALVSAPYSYDGAVAELFFATFKCGELNLQGVATSKSKCISIANLPQNIFKM